MSPQGARRARPAAKSALDEVRQRRGAHVGDRRADLAAPAVFGVDAVGGHQPLDALVVDAQPPPAQLVGHPGAAVGVVEVVVDLAHLVDEQGLVPLGRRWARPRLRHQS